MIVDVRGVTKVYRPSPPLMRMLLRSAIREPVRALTDVDLQMEAGEICAVVGPNGAGKSTLFRILTGLTTPTSGSASIVGFDVTEESHQVRRHVGFAPAEERTLLLRHSCFENLRFHGQMQGMDPRTLNARIDETLEQTGLAHAKDRIGFALSTGMRARLQLARAMLHRPDVLILDEPTGAVDPVAAAEVLQVIKRAAAEDGTAVLVSSHRLEEIQALHDKVILINKGQVVYSGDLDALRNEWQKPRVRVSFLSTADATSAAQQLAGAPSIDIAYQEDNELVLNTDQATGTVLAHLTGGIANIEAIQPINMSLMDLLADVLADDDLRHADPEAGGRRRGATRSEADSPDTRSRGWDGI